MTSYAQVVKRALRPHFVRFSVSRVPRIAFTAMTCAALPQERRTAGFASRVMTANALSAFLGLMSKRGVWVRVRLMGLVAKANDASPSLQVEFLDLTRNIVALAGLAFAIALRARLSRKQSSGRDERGCEQYDQCQLKSHTRFRNKPQMNTDKHRCRAVAAGRLAI